MTSWAEVAAAHPEFAAAVRACFDAHKHKTLATVRRDGSPRISGIEASFVDGELWLAGMPRARKFADLRGDPRLALHSASEDPPAWKGDAKVSGRAVEVTDAAARARFAGSLDEEPPQFELFRVELTDVVWTRLNDAGDQLVIEWWTPAGGLRQVERS